MYAYNPCCTYKVRICCTQTSMLNAYNQYAVTIQCVCHTHTVVCFTHTVRNTHIVHLYYAYSTHTVRMLYAYIFIYYASCNRLFFLSVFLCDSSARGYGGPRATTCYRFRSLSSNQPSTYLSHSTSLSLSFSPRDSFFESESPHVALM